MNAVAIETFIHFAQAWLDRGWLWHASPEVTQRRLRLTGDLQALSGDTRVVICCISCWGWRRAARTAATQQVARRFTTIYTHQANKTVDEWVHQGRMRFGHPKLFDRSGGARPIVVTLRAGEVLYLLPDMNYGLPESGVRAVFRGAGGHRHLPVAAGKTGRCAKAVPVVTRMTPQGYEVVAMPAWTDFPGDDLTHDAHTMNLRLQAYIETMPSQYYWVHKRFKDRPEGKPVVDAGHKPPRLKLHLPTARANRALAALCYKFRSV